MRVILLGPPASGKGTQAAQMSVALGVPAISTGEMFRQASGRMKQKVESYTSNGELVPDDVVIEVVQERLAQDDARKGFILDGFPRTLRQAEWLWDHTDGLEAAVLLEVPDAHILERIGGRRTDPQTGRIYNLALAPPPADVQARLEQRKDDTPEVMRTRLKTYHAEATPLIGFCGRKGVLHHIDGTRTPEQVFADILKVLRHDGSSPRAAGVR